MQPAPRREMPRTGFGSPLRPRALLWRAVRSGRRDLIAASVLYSSHQLGESMVPVIIGATISKAIDHGSWQSMGLWLAVLAADFALLSMSYRFGARASMRSKQYAGHQVRMWLTERVVQPAGGVRQAPGDLLSRASSDAGRVGAFAGTVASTIAATVVLIVATLLLLRFSVLLGAVIIVGTVVLLFVQNRVSRLLRRRSTVEQHQQARATVLAEDLIRGLRVLRGIGVEHTAADNYRRVSQGAVGASLHAVSSQATLAAVGSIFTGAYVTVIAGIGGWLALDGKLVLGQLVAALGLAQFVIGPMRAVSNASAAYARAIASATRIHEVLATEPAVAERHGAPAAPAGDGRVDFDGLAWDAGVQLNVALDAGTMIGLACGDPALAAALPRLLAREADPDAGRILLDGTDIALLGLDDLRARILVSPHDAVLFPGSIADNLRALNEDPDAVAEATRAAFADQVLDAVPDGSQTLVGDRGEILSGGQRQRIALARALAADSPVLVLHDPTIAVDAVTEDRIAEQVHHIRAGRTTFVITTSPAWLSRCEQVILLRNDGVEVGLHARLLADCAAYRDLVAR